MNNLFNSIGKFHHQHKVIFYLLVIVICLFVFGSGANYLMNKANQNQDQEEARMANSSSHSSDNQSTQSSKSKNPRSSKQNWNDYLEVCQRNIRIAVEGSGPRDICFVNGDKNPSEHAIVRKMNHIYKMEHIKKSDRIGAKMYDGYDAVNREEGTPIQHFLGNPNKYRQKNLAKMPHSYVMHDSIAYQPEGHNGNDAEQPFRVITKMTVFFSKNANKSNNIQKIVFGKWIQ